MRKIILVLLTLPLFAEAQFSRGYLDAEADTIRLETHAGRNTAQRVGRMFKNQNASFFNVTDVLPKASGGTGTATPALVAGTNVTITGSWPNQTINSSGGGGGITNSAPANHIMMSDGTNAIESNISVSGSDYTFGSASAGQVAIIANGSGNANIVISSQGNGQAALTALNHTINTSNSSNLLQINTASTNSVQNAAIFRAATSGTTATGFGSSIKLSTTNAALNAFLDGVSIEAVSTSMSGGSETFDLHVKTMFTGTSIDRLILKSSGNLSWSNLVMVNGWVGSKKLFRVTPQGNLDLGLNLDASSATTSTFATLSSLDLPVSSGTLIFTGINGTGGFMYVVATITSSSTITFTCPQFTTTSPNNTVKITGSIPIESAF